MGGSNQFTLWLEQLLWMLLTFLLTNGADVDAHTNNQVGEYSPLKIAMDNHGKNHPEILFLQNHGVHVLSAWDNDIDNNEL